MSDIETLVDFKQSPFDSSPLAMANRVARPWLMFDRLYARTSAGTAELNHSQRKRAFTRSVLDARRRSPHRIQPDDFCLIDMLSQVHANNPVAFSEPDLVEQAITFMLAGQDATSSALSFSLFLLAQHPECQRRARDEIDAVIGDRSNDCEPITVDQLRRLRYTEQCVREAMRLYPSVPLIGRVLSEPLDVTATLRLPTGSSVLMFPYFVHRNAAVWPAPERYEPARFASAAAADRHPCAYVPFSAGQRMCIGDRFAMLEMLVLVAAVLREFAVQPVEGRTEVRPTFKLALRAAGGLWVRLSKRT